MASSSNPIANSATTTSDYYDAFLSHRGSDVKETLATHLHERLTDCGMRVFLDKEELQEGDNIPSQLKGAIRSAAVHIAIFSTNYAESTWCLNELLLMFESGKPIIPIFYGVMPSELRYALGEYGRHLDLLEKKKAMKSENPRYDLETVKEWRDALRKASNIMGFEVKAEACNSYDMQLLNKVVKRVLEKLPKTRLNVSKYPTGLDDKIKDFERTVLMPQHSRETRVVGIVGLGGVGKTTLAKEFFNRERSKYDRSCFLPDVREKAACRSLNSLETILLKDLTGSNVPINSTADGIEEIRRRVSCCRPKALIIVDDVDHVDQQLDVLLLLLKDALGFGSLILVTSRNKDVLTSFGIIETSIYKLEGLHRHQSRELFCSRAFDQPNPVKGYEQLVEEFLNACHGLPLSLQVIGLLLRKEDLNHWKAQLRKIQRILPDDIQGSLRISYDGLDEEEKHIFLDIACFFIGEDKDTTIRIWDGFGWEGCLGLRKLENRCLVEVDNKNCIRMHDHVRDLGRNLAEKEPPGRELRCWCPTDNFFRNLSGRSPVRAINLVHGNGSEQFFKTVAGSCDLSRLQFLRAQGDFVKRVFTAQGGFVERVFSARKFPQLRYLRWENCLNCSIPSLIPIKNLTMLYIQGENLKKLWKDESQAPLELRELVIDSPLSKLPKSIGQLKHLELIILKCSSTGNLKTLPEEFCRLQSLKRFELTNYSKIKSLPHSFGNLTNLEHINLSRSENLERLPDSFRDLIRLKYLDLSRCNNLTISSKTLGNIETLEYINLNKCMKIEELPPQVALQQSLEELSCSFLEMVPSKQGRDFKELKLRQGRNYKEFRCLPISDKLLNKLTKLTVIECVFSALPFENDSGEPETSASIQSRGERILSNLGSSIDMSKLLQLRHLILYKTEISEVSFAGGFCPNLQQLLIGSCDNLVKVGTLPNALIKLELTRCAKLEKIEGLSDLAKLQELNIKWCGELVELSSIETLASLEALDVYDCRKLKRIGRLAKLTKLRRLDIVKCSELEELVGVEDLMSRLDIVQRSEVKEIAGVEDFMSLKSLDLSECPNLKLGEGVGEKLHKSKGNSMAKF